MFTGIVEDIAKVTLIEMRNLSQGGGGESVIQIQPQNQSRFADVVLGESISCNGVCLTVAETPSKGTFIFYVSPETLSKTQLGELKPGSLINLERALAAKGRFSGHIVQGHVDGVGKVTVFEKVGASHKIAFRLPPTLMRYCIDKGSICLNGVSLTVNRCSADEVEVMIIPHTLENTQFKTMQIGDPVNVEVDVLAKYVEKLMATRIQN